MEISTVLLLLTAIALVIAFVRLYRAPARNVIDWWATFACVALIAVLSFVLVPTVAGYVSFGSLSLLVLAPLRLDRAAQRRARQGDGGIAMLLARIAALLHPFGAIGGRPAAIRALAELRVSGAVDPQTLVMLAGRDPMIREWYRLLALHVTDDSAAIRAALAIPARRARILHLGFGPAFVRAIASAGDRAAILDAIEEAERSDATLDEADRRALLALEASAALGDVEGAQEIGAELSARAPKGAIERALAAAYWARGDLRRAHQTIDRALAAGVDPGESRSLLRLRERPAPPSAELTRALETRTIALLQRLRREAVASAALAPLVDGGHRPAYATSLLAAAIVAWYAVVASTGDPTDSAHLARMGGLVLPIENAAGALRLFSAAFVHFGWLHLVFNLYALFAFGRFVESFFGRVRFAAIWIAATLTSGLAVAYTAGATSHVLVGASGAIFGLGGALVTGVGLSPELRKSRRGREELKSFAALVAIQMLFDRLVPQVSGTAHVGGLLGGMLAGALLLRGLKRPGPLRSKPS